MKQTLTVFSPAKVNLQLEIGERRTDGFHQAKSIMQALTLHDMVTVVLDDGVDAYLNPDGFSDFAIDVTCTTFEGIPELDVAPESNIAYKAAAALAEKLGHEQGHISHPYRKAYSVRGRPWWRLVERGGRYRRTVPCVGRRCRERGRA